MFWKQIFCLPNWKPIAQLGYEIFGHSFLYTPLTEFFNQQECGDEEEEINDSEEDDQSSDSPETEKETPKDSIETEMEEESQSSDPIETETEIAKDALKTERELNMEKNIREFIPFYYEMSRSKCLCYSLHLVRHICDELAGAHIIK
jgi:hypothetical protein